MINTFQFVDENLLAEKGVLTGALAVYLGFAGLAGETTGAKFPVAKPLRPGQRSPFKFYFI